MNDLHLEGATFQGLRIMRRLMLVLALLHLSPSITFGQLYDIIEVAPPSARESCAWAINERGQIAGEYKGRDEIPRAFLWENGTARDLGTLGGNSSIAHDINESGTVVGIAALPNGAQHAFIYRDGVLTDLGSLGGGSGALSVNDDDVAAGLAFTPQGTIPVRFDMGQVVRLWTHGRANDINNQGYVVGGWNGALGVVRLPNGEVQTLPTLGVDRSDANSVNDLGQIVGMAKIPNGDRHAALWQDGAIQDLSPELPKGKDAEALGINNVGQVVGWTGGQQGAFLWQDGEFMFLDDLLPDDAGWTTRMAADVNDKGQIVGSGWYNGRLRAFVLTPVSEPVPPSVFSSVPTDRHIDPGAEIGGIDTMVISFDQHVRLPDDGSGVVRALDASAFTITSTDNPAIPGTPLIQEVVGVERFQDSRSYRLTFSRPIPVGEWTTVVAHVASIVSKAEARLAIRLAHLPCDINGDGVVNIRDATAFGEEFRGDRRPELIDLNRSGTVNISDATTFGRLWRGEAPSSRTWAGAKLPELDD